MLYDCSGYKFNIELRFVEAIGPIFELIKDPELNTYATELAGAILARIKDNEEKDIKEVDKMGIKNFFKSIKDLLNQMVTTEISDKIKFTLLTQRLNSKNLVRQIQAIQMLEDEYEIFSIGIIANNIVSKSPYKMQDPISKECKNVLRILKEIEVTKVIFGEDTEAEFVKKSKYIMHLLVIYDIFKLEDMKMMAKCYHGIFIIRK